MIQTNCSKCDGELILHDGYGVCSKCGEIIGFDIEEEIEETIEEVNEAFKEPAETVEEQEVLEKTPEVVEEIEEIVSETEDVSEEQEETQEFIQKSEEFEAAEETVEEKVVNDFPEEFDFPKRRKAPIIILIAVILCVLAVLGGYFISKANQGKVDTDAENIIPEEDVIPQDDTEQEPRIIDEEPETEAQIPKEPEKEETIPQPEPAPIKQEIPKKETVKKEDAVVSPTPSISYRIRKSADDSNTQIGAFSDLERAKAFALTHSADGYKVFDMNGQLVFEP